MINVLLVGSDSRDPNAELGRSDTMILASFNKAEGKATALSFLRDSLVEIDGHGQSKLGHTFAYGGVGSDDQHDQSTVRSGCAGLCDH